MQLKNLNIYAFAFVATQNGVLMPLIGLCHINANQLWIFGHNVGQYTSIIVNNQK
jgi:hypothetical protein